MGVPFFVSYYDVIPLVLFPAFMSTILTGYSLQSETTIINDRHIPN